MTYNISWGPVPWLYQSEIFPTRIREGAMAVGTATQWLFNFTFSQITPHAVENLGWKTFLMFCIFNWALVVYTWFFIKEVSNSVYSRQWHDANTIPRQKVALWKKWSLVSPHD